MIVVGYISDCQVFTFAENFLTNSGNANDKQQAYNTIARLVERFHEYIDEYKQGAYTRNRHG